MFGSGTPVLEIHTQYLEADPQCLEVEHQCHEVESLQYLEGVKSSFET